MEPGKVEKYGASSDQAAFEEVHVSGESFSLLLEALAREESTEN